MAFKETLILCLIIVQTFCQKSGETEEVYNINLYITLPFGLLVFGFLLCFLYCLFSSICREERQLQPQQIDVNASKNVSLTAIRMAGPVDKSAAIQTPQSRASIQKNETVIPLNQMKEAVIPQVKPNESAVPSNQSKETAIPLIKPKETAIRFDSSTKAVGSRMSSKVKAIPSDDSRDSEEEDDEEDEEKPMMLSTESAIPSMDSKDTAIPSMKRKEFNTFDPKK